MTDDIERTAIAKGMDVFRAELEDADSHLEDAVRAGIVAALDVVGRRHEPKHPDAVGNRERQRANQPKGEA